MATAASSGCPSFKGKGDFLAKASCPLSARQALSRCCNADKDFLTNQLNASVLDKDYLIWLARWGVSPGYSGLFSFWQFCSAGRLRDPVRAVDRDVWYVPLGFVDI
jgi:hypothetical protein